MMFAFKKNILALSQVIDMLAVQPISWFGWIVADSLTGSIFKIMHSFISFILMVVVCFREDIMVSVNGNWKGSTLLRKKSRIVRLTDFFFLSANITFLCIRRNIDSSYSLNIIFLVLQVAPDNRPHLERLIHKVKTKTNRLHIYLQDYMAYIYLFANVDVKIKICQ